MKTPLDEATDVIPEEVAEAALGRDEVTWTSTEQVGWSGVGGPREQEKAGRDTPPSWYSTRASLHLSTRASDRSVEMMTSTLPCRTNEWSGRALSRDDWCERTNNDVQGRSLDGEPGAEVRNSGLGEESSDEDSELEGLDRRLAGEGRVEVRPFKQRRQKGCKPSALEKKADQ